MPIVIQKIRDIDAAGLITNHPDQQANYDWSDLLWGALSVGRRSMLDVFAFGSFSIMEMVWRCAIVRANIGIQPSYRPRTDRFGFTPAFDALDGSEKGAVTYFLGLILAKLAAQHKLDVPWLWHLDVYGRLNNPYGPPTRAVAGGGGNSRPDLVGQSITGEWLICEAKGRSRGVTDQTRQKAKNQARMISLINGSLPRWRFASIARFSGSFLTQEWIDPEGWLPEAEALSLAVGALYANYYQTVFSFLNASDGLGPAEVRYFGRVRYRVREIPGVDVWLGVDERILELRGDMGRIRDESELSRLRSELANPIIERPSGVTVGKDGIYVEVGKKWRSSPE